MGTARDPQPVKLIFSLLTGNTDLLPKARGVLAEHYGRVEWLSDLLPFDHTDYYAAEFGSGLQRQISVFEPLIDPAELPAIKHQANRLESAMAEGEQRPINIDPGYVSLGKLVLASTKDHAHRLYLERGIYGEVTLTFQRGRFRSWPWSYPDYASEEYCRLFDAIRERYKRQLRAGGG
jgi:hypothetical protein